MFLLSLAFGFIALAIASNFLKKPWMWYTIGGVVFAITAVSVKFKLVIPVVIIALIIALIALYLLIVEQINKRR